MLTDLKAALKDSPVTPAFWACCHLCNKITLEFLISGALFTPSAIKFHIEDSFLIPSLCELPALRLYCGFVEILTVYRDPALPLFVTPKFVDVKFSDRFKV